MNLLKLALPKGRLLRETGGLLERAGLGLDEYSKGGRCYRLESSSISYICAKVFQEKDIPVQVAIGNYDLGICGFQWAEELSARFPKSPLTRVLDLGYGGGSLYAVTSKWSRYTSVPDLSRDNGILRIVSEYPNLSASLAVQLRLRRFKVFPVWGSAEAYPPENSDVAVLWLNDDGSVLDEGLITLIPVMSGNALLIANRNSWESKEMGAVLTSLRNAAFSNPERDIAAEKKKRIISSGPPPEGSRKETVWLALPDGHQQVHTAAFLSRIGIVADGYSAESDVRSPSFGMPGVKVKVVRPQDMPLHVANGNFDLAITGRDWLRDHLYRFPSSPVMEVLDLGFGKVKIVAAISNDVPAEDIPGLRRWMRMGNMSPLRVASEYVNIADKFLQDNHLSPYKVIPTWGASEAFLPEDADILVENTETGQTLAEHNLKVIHTLTSSSACLIANKDALISPERGYKVKDLIDVMDRGVEKE